MKWKEIIVGLSLHFLLQQVRHWKQALIFSGIIQWHKNKEEPWKLSRSSKMEADNGQPLQFIFY